MMLLVNPEAIFYLALWLFLAFVFAIGSAFFVLYLIPLFFHWSSTLKERK